MTKNVAPNHNVADKGEAGEHGEARIIKHGKQRKCDYTKKRRYLKNVPVIEWNISANPELLKQEENYRQQRENYGRRGQYELPLLP